ncbi:MAG: type 1 glutamine amidotransferase [Rhodothermia bacterium]
MADRFEDLTVRLLQVRLKPDIEAEEYETFVQRTGLSHRQLLTTNVLKDSLDRRILDGIDAVIIGGAGAYSVTRTYPWTEDLILLVQQIHRRRTPLFGSCWGHQFIARTFGGSVVHDPERGEIGCMPVELTGAGRTDELFGGFPTTFMANMGHHDRVDRLPEGAVELATSSVSRYQAFKFIDRPIYGTQFHSELDAETERARLDAYRDYYPVLQDEKSFQSIVRTLRPTTEVDGLLNLFLRTFALTG